MSSHKDEENFLINVFSFHPISLIIQNYKYKLFQHSPFFGYQTNRRKSHHSRYKITNKSRNFFKNPKISP